MKSLKLLKLELLCKDPNKVFSFDISDALVVHGQIASGKSSFVRLIYFAMGGDFYEDTVALQRRLDSVQLTLRIEQTTYLVERKAHAEQIQITDLSDENLETPPKVFKVFKRKKNQRQSCFKRKLL